MKQWAKKHERCIECSTTAYQHEALGKCILCYRNIFRNRERAKLKGKHKRAYYLKVADAVRKWRNRNPLKVKAHRKVFVEIRAGRIEKFPCEVCGDDIVHAHHDDYNKPLIIRWFCSKHHGILSRKFNQNDCK